MSDALTEEEIRAFRTRYPNWPADMLAGFVGGLLASGILVLLLAWQADWVATTTLEANPTCDSPLGLHRVTVSEATGANEPDRRDARTEEAEGLPVYAASRAVDDASQTLWIPPLKHDPEPQADLQLDTSLTPRFETEGDQNVLRLQLADVANIRLVCIVNGATLWYTSYQNWGRVRAIRVWGESRAEAHVTVLRSLGSDDFPNAQQAARGVGDTRVVYIALIDAYVGQRVETFNPSACLEGAVASVQNGQTPFKNNADTQPFELADGIKYRYEPGCILEPKEKAGVAEVYLYAED